MAHRPGAAGRCVSPGVQHRSLQRRSAPHRAALARRTGTLKAGAGLFHQQPTALIQLPIIDVDGLIFGLPEGAEFDVGAEWKGESGLQASADVYFNPLLRTLELEQGLQDGSATADQFLRRVGSSGYATGLELMVRHPLGKNWFGWISYTLQRSVRRTTFERLDGFGASTGTATATLPYTYDQTHVFNAVVSYKLSSNWTLGATLHFNTGRPEAGNMTSTTMREGVGAQGQAAWIKVSRDQVDRLPPFWRIDVRGGEVVVEPTSTIWSSARCPECLDAERGHRFRLSDPLGNDIPSKEGHLDSDYSPDIGRERDLLTCRRAPLRLGH